MEKEVFSTVVADEKDKNFYDILQELKELFATIFKSNKELEEKFDTLVQSNNELETKFDACQKTNKGLEGKFDELKVIVDGAQKTSKELEEKFQSVDEALKTNRVFSLRFFIDYILSIYKVAGGNKVLDETVERQLVVKHAIEGFNEILPLNEDITAKLKTLQQVFSKASQVHCDVGTIRDSACAIARIAKDCARDSKLWEDIIDTDGLGICEKMFVEVFGDTVEAASASDELKYNKIILLRELWAK